MENYNIYDEIGRGTHSFVYKARRKRSIEYVAVKSTAKSRMEKILNEVPFLHKLESPHVLKFFDWYESSNHIWLILEYCMGGDLLNLITQDKELPESTVQSFGLELVAGLQYLHSNSILYCDVKPANILIDEYGSLKLADFGLARRIPGCDDAPARQLAPGSPHYMAPELFQQPAVHSFASDFWALGCVLYELRTGRQPFIHTSFSELARMIQTESVELPVAGCAMSPSFCDFLQRLLVKDPYQRLSWDELVDHAFWNPLPRLKKVTMPRQVKFDSNAPDSIKSAPCVRLSGQRNDQAALKDFKHDLNDMRPEIDHDNDKLDCADVEDHRDYNLGNERNNASWRSPLSSRCDGDLGSEELESERGSQIDSPSHDKVRPLSAPSCPSSTLQSYSNDTYNDCDDIMTNLAQLAMIRQRWKGTSAPNSAPPALRNAENRRLQLHKMFDCSALCGNKSRKLSKLVFTARDCQVKSIIGNKDMQVEDLPCVRADLVQLPLMSPQELLSCSMEALEAQLKAIYVRLKTSQDLAKLSVLAFLFTLSCDARLAHVIVNSSILKLLIRMLAQEAPLRNPDKRSLSMLCLVLGILFRFATFIAPSSPDQFQFLVTSLLRIIHAPCEDKVGIKQKATLTESQSRPLALACLGELLFYISTQHEWTLPTEGVETMLTCMADTDVAAQFYSVRTFGNMLIHCTDSLVVHLLNENSVLTLMRGLVPLATSMTSEDNREQKKAVALHTAITEALGQVLRHLRTPSSIALLSSRLQRSVLLFFAKPEVLRAVWRGIERTHESSELAIASLNILNAFLNTKLRVDSDVESTAIKSSRSLLLDRIVAFPTICNILAMVEGTDSAALDAASLTILQAKSLILLHLGIHLNRGFLLSFVQLNVLDLVEKLVDPIADQLCASEPNPSSQSMESNFLASKLYLAQCALNVFKLSIRMALKLGAVCFSTHESEHDDARSSTNAGRQSFNISPVPFELFTGLLRNPNCRQQLFTYFVANTSKQYTFFLRLMTRLLLSFSSEMIVCPWKGEATITIAHCVSDILLPLFEHAAIEANEIVMMEHHTLFRRLLPAVVKHVDGVSAETREPVAVNCLRILQVVLLEFDYTSAKEENQVYKVFVQSILIPHFNTLFAGRQCLIEQVWRLSSNLLYGVLSTDQSLLQQVQVVHNLVPTLLSLLRVPHEFHSLPLHAPQLVQLLLDSKHVTLDVLYESGLARSVVAALTFAFNCQVRDESVLDLMVLMFTLLHQQVESMQRPEAVITPLGVEELVSCGPLLLQFCARSGQTVANAIDSIESQETRRRDDELADVASCCLVFLSQIFGEQFNSAMFCQRCVLTHFIASANKTSLMLSIQSSALAQCLQVKMNGVVVLRVLRALQNCLCSKTTDSLVRQFISENGRIFSMIEVLASETQSFEAISIAESTYQCVKEQIVETANAITRLCRTLNSP